MVSVSAIAARCRISPWGTLGYKALCADPKQAFARSAGCKMIFRMTAMC
jgi:hypothetical protein